MVSSEMQLLEADRSALNHDIDALINTFAVVDQIEKDVKQTEENIDLIFKTLNGLSMFSVNQIRKSQSTASVGKMGDYVYQGYV